MFNNTSFKCLTFFLHFICTFCRSEGGNLCQWFHFAVTNVRPGTPYKFNLVNFRKKQSLISAGKQPLVCLATRPATAAVTQPGSATALTQGQQQQDEAASRSAGITSTSSSGASSSSHQTPHRWVRAGTNIAYYPSPYRGRSALSADKKKKSAAAAGGSGGAGGSGTKKGGKGGKGAGKSTDAGLGLPDNVGPGLYCCTFTLTFDQPGVYFVASCYPYSYSELQVRVAYVCFMLHMSALCCICLYYAAIPACLHG